jgi:hypothetical protein
MTEKTGQMMPWEVPANAQAPPTLATGQMMGSSNVGLPTMTQMEHPAINADRSGITGNIGGGRLNPYGGGALQENAPPLRYAPTTGMPTGRLFPEEVFQPRMGGEIATGNQPPSSSVGLGLGRVRVGTAEPTLHPRGYGNSFY